MQKPIFEIKDVKNKVIDKYLEETREILNDFFGISYKPPRIFLLTNKKQMDILYGRKVPNWIEGHEYGKCIYIFKHLLKDLPKRFRELIIHESVHVHLEKFCNGECIRIFWLEEGLACYIAQQKKFPLPNKLNLETLKSLSDNSITDDYSTSYFWISWLIYRYGKQNLLKFIKRKNEMTNFKKIQSIFLEVFGEKIKSPVKKIKNTKHINFYKFDDFKLSNNYSNKCKNHIKKVCQTFNIKFKDKFDYFIFPNEETYKNILGWSPTGRVKNNILYSVFDFHPHEITHIIFNTVNKSTLSVLSEGVAVLYGWGDKTARWKGKPLEYWMHEYKNKTNLKDLIINFGKIDNCISYPMSAYFVKWLIDNFGISKFKQLYKQLNYQMSLKEKDLIFKKITKFSINQLNTKFLLSIT